jgi:hypothetical protein
MTLVLVIPPAPPPIPEPRTVFWIEHADGWRVDVVECPPLSPAGYAYRGIITAPTGRRIHKTLPFPTPAEAEQFANAIADCERTRARKYRPRWYWRALAWTLRFFRLAHP